jgi:serine/threonine-protein kinase
VTPEGRLKVLDFGLAKAMTGDPAAGDPESSPTLTMRATMAGMIIGTAAYMSPEQARGKAVDKRSDIFAFGAVLYELLTGKHAFGGETISDSLAVILTKEPDRALLPPDTPPNLRRLLDRCLEKDPKRRLRDIGEARILLDQPAEAPKPRATPRARQSVLPWTLAAAALLAAGVATWAWLRTPKPAPRPVFHLVAPAQLARFPFLAISRDGSKLAFSSGQLNQFSVRSSDQMEARPIPGTEESASAAFSPDGQWLAFAQGPSPPQRKLKKVQVSGGTVITLCDVSPFGIDWGHDGNIVVGSTSGLLRVSAAGGKAETLTSIDFKKGEFSHQFPHILPAGDAVLFTIVGPAANVKIAVLSLKTHAQRVLFEAGSSPRYVPAAPGAAGQLIYWRAGSLFAIPFDPRRLEVTGSPVPILEGVASVSGRANIGGAAYTVSEGGVLVYLAGSAASFASSALVWVDRQGKELPAPGRPAPAAPYRAARLSPDGKLVAVGVGGGTQNHIAVYDAVRGTLTPLTFQGHADYPAWSSDGKRLAFVLTDSGKNFIAWVPSDGSRPPETVATLDKAPVLSAWSPDGKILAYHQLEMPTDIWLLPFTPAGNATPVRYQETPYAKFGAQFSPDGRWLAYGATSERNASWFSQSTQVFVQPAPAIAAGSGPAPKWQVSVDGGTGPRWSADSRELFYRNGDKVMSVAIEPGATFRAGTPRVLFEGRYEMTFPSGTGYDVSPDGKRFIMIKRLESEGASAQIHFVLDWFDEVRRRVRAGTEGQ